jgi:SAM-dependent methyltransferase
MQAWLTQLPEAEWDAAVDELFELDPFVPDAADLPPGCVPYIAAPVSALVRLSECVALDVNATFVDVGSGVGRAALFVHLLTGARSFGVEIQPHLVALGNAAAQRLATNRVSLLHGDACDASRLPAGDCYFMYCPFDASRVKRVLAILEARAISRELTVACLQLSIPDCAWLQPVASGVADLRMYRSQGVRSRAHK